jgi:hypothetical protein
LVTLSFLVEFRPFSKVIDTRRILSRIPPWAAISDTYLNGQPIQVSVFSGTSEQDKAASFQNPGKSSNAARIAAHQIF